MKRKEHESGHDDIMHQDKRAAIARSPSPLTNTNSEPATGATAASSSSSSSSLSTVAVANGDVDRHVRGITRHIVQTYTTPQEFERAQYLSTRPNSVQSLFILYQYIPLSATPSSSVVPSSPPVNDGSDSVNGNGNGSDEKDSKSVEEDIPVYVLTASVHDLLVAHVRITIRGSNVQSTSCTCGYEDALWCVHIAAVFLKLQTDRTSAIPRFGDTRAQISGMERRDLENMLLAHLANPSYTMITLLSTSPSNIASLSHVDVTPVVDTNQSAGIANWAAYARKMVNIFDKPRADACACQCHKAYEWYRGVRVTDGKKKDDKKLDESRDGWACVTCRIYHDECRDYSVAHATMREAVACAKYMIKNGHLMDAHALLKNATSAFLVAVKSQSKGRVDEAMVGIVLGHISSAIRRVALSFETPATIRDEYISLLKEWKRVHPNYDFGENYVEWSTDSVARVMRGDEVAIRSFGEPSRVADDRISALTAAKKYVECLFYARAVNQVKICAHMLLYLRRLVEANAVAQGAIQSLDDALEFAKLMHQQEVAMAAAGQVVAVTAPAAGQIAKPVPTTFSFLQSRLETLTKVRHNVPSQVVKEALDLLCSTIRHDRDEVTKERSSQVQFLIGKLATSVEQKYRLAQLLQEQGHSNTALEVAMEHLLDTDTVKRGYLTRAMCSWIADVAWAAALVAPTCDRVVRQCRSEDHIIAFLRVLVKRSEYVEGLRLVTRWLDEIDDHSGRSIAGLSIDTAQLLLETAAHVGATELTTMIQKLLQPAANQKAVYVSKLITALEQTSNQSSINLQVMIDLAQKKLQWSLTDKKLDECRSAMAQLLTISQKQDTAAAAVIAASKEEGELKEGEPDNVDVREDGRDMPIIGRHMKQTIVYLSHVFKDGAQIMDLATFLKDRGMIAEALPLALKALQAHAWTDEKSSAGSSSSSSNDDRFSHIAEYLELARRELDRYPPGSVAIASDGTEPIDYLNLAKSMALELVNRYPTRDHFLQCRTLFLELEAKYPGGSKLAKKWSDVQTQVIKDLFNSALALGGGQQADRYTGTVLEIFLAASCIFEAADLIRIRTDRLQTPALLTHCVDVLAAMGPPQAEATYDKIWPTGIRTALSSLGNSGIYGQARDALLHALDRHFPSKLQAAASMLASGLAVAIKKRGDKTTFDASSATKSSAFFQWVTASQLVFQLADAEMEWQSTLRDIELYNGNKVGFVPSFNQFKTELPAFIRGRDALITTAATAVTPATTTGLPTSAPVLQSLVSLSSPSVAATSSF